MMYTGPMHGFLGGFQDELEKLAAPDKYDPDKERRRLNRALRRITKDPGKHPLKNLRGTSSPRQRDYLASAGITAATFPLMGLIGARIGRSLRNKTTMQALQKASRRDRRMLAKKLETGPLIAKSHLKRKPGQVSREDLVTRAATGGILGSVVMALRDRFAGSTPAH